MMIKVKVTTNSKVELVRRVGPSEYALKVKEKAVAGRANAAVIALLSSYFNVKKSQIMMIRGHAGREKLIEIRMQLPGTLP
ncbi:MAG: DUF167 domain-containing protein [Candidatus Micrarchaeota archaeon]|nr:DUF167 domain-containing protein [Candidatus Micrarchaeota archaeon]MDE1823866.1 DUF167 domain-containing protein [Candidatus Micrarchaeota archaeon]MDE1849443.1 DUF167 domain-containing protein [Candidatus Micrarchaeota archaeon]